MIIYATIVLTLSVLVSLYVIQTEGKEAMWATLIGLAIELPIFGRVFGWW